MSRVRTGKVLVSFAGGELAPDLDSRTDLDLATSAVRTLKNFRTDIYGGAIRRPGLQYIAAVRTPPQFDYVSYEGSGTIYGITEFGDLSDPPRKYLRLESSYAGRVQRDTTLAVLNLSKSVLNVAQYDTTGSRTEAPTGADGDNNSGTITGGYGYPNIQTATEIAFDSPGNSFESVQVPASWGPYIPTWTRSKTSKYFTDADLPATPSEATRLLARLMQGFNRTGGLQGTSRGALLYGLTWTGTAWQFNLFVEGDTASIGVPAQIALYAKLKAGDSDPGTVTTSDAYLGTTTGSGGGNPVTKTYSITVPPDTSIRFLMQRGAVATQFPQQIDEKYTNGISSASGLTDSLFDRWFYFPALEADLPAWKYEERLGFEDTMEDALIRASVSPGTESTAETSAYSGGTTAESVDPITFTSRTVHVSYTLTGLTSGNRYEWTITLRTRLIGGGAPTDSTHSEQFVASGSSQPVEYLMVAPVGYQQTVVSIANVDLGPDPAPPTQYETETLVAYGRVLAAGSTWNTAQLTLANDLVVALKALSSFTKIRYILPFIGPDLAAALVPLIDSAFLGLPTNANFVDADFSESTGLKGNGSNKILDLPLTPSQAPGVGFWENDFDLTGTGTEALGCYSNDATQRFVLDLRSTRQFFSWGLPANIADYNPHSMTNGDWYGQRLSSTSRRFYLDGTFHASNTTADAASGSANRTMRLMGSDEAGGGLFYWKGRCAIAYFTDGTLSDAEVTALHTALASFISATGR